MTYGKNITINTQGFSDIINITPFVQKIINESNVENGIVCVSAIGSTASVTTIEFEPALVEDFKEYLNKFAPDNVPTRHGNTWGDDNGFSHIRASLMGPSVTLPVESGKLLLGTWQQIVVIDHDNRPRSRKIRVQITGE